MLVGMWGVLSGVTDKLDAHPRRPSRPKTGPLIELRDVHERFAALSTSTEPEPVRTMRGVGLAVAEHWLIRLPAGPARDKALAALSDAVDLAAEAYSPAA